ncbi:IQ calmodulin-binding motif domain-containing protein [Verticillium alfalfae VaMs.102]|uniref:IQ calmodulin-binding motif domain-containing protein n=1 Tax=Verticillium alfalfae (strain VaMs.102 / ATCC MYA-4576 / FGSC 10136) TaxID=526221 RepID=C9SL27_VERA1|nr:IQ calmodulin-binding motif domain-containing protein [Verticillium alfalfae VaMs.102]EEY19395.1 IQ calmodulin-binding motif domain-containing protein [Verticillium alfalfae VaMs.102]
MVVAAAWAALLLPGTFQGGALALSQGMARWPGRRCCLDTSDIFDTFDSLPALANMSTSDPVDPDYIMEEAVVSPGPLSNEEAASEVNVNNIDLTMPPISDDDVDNDDAVGHIHTPPPRIAARFYRPTQTRRKDSAASSRRNSISSAHSRCSSAHNYTRRNSDGHQSKLIAQHLRRTSFLEDRKARLADRAAHAEKVRIRAALAKATPRGTSSSEERALAAQQAREKKLAEIVASCAEDVKKARAVAESMKEKRETELARVKARMEERMAEADRRREELKNRSASKRFRGQSLTNKKTSLDVLPEDNDDKDSGEFPPSSPPSSAKRAKAKQSPSYTEDEAAGKLQWWWRAVQRKRAVGEFAELGLTVDGIRDTTFDSVVDLLGQERVLLRTARILRICGLQEGQPGSVGEMAAVRTFLSAFIILGHPAQVLSNKDGTAQQEQVGAQLPQPMPHDDLANPQLQDLTVKDSTDDASPSRIERGKKMIADAVRQARKARAANKPTADMKPRVSDSAEGSATAASLVSSGDQTVTPPATPLKASTKPQPPLPIVLPPGLSGLLPQNRVVVHELAINREYRIPADEYCEHRATFQQPLFEGMRAELHSNESEAGFMYFATMMRYFKESLQRLVRPGAFMHKTIGEVLDVELAEQQFQMGSFSYEKFFTAVSSLLPKLCAPYRDEECKDLVTNKLHQGTLVDRVEALTGFIDVMLCDYVNYMLSTAAPQLIESGPQYEAKKFDEALEKGHHKLTAAVEAWRSARLKVLAEASKRDPEGINHAKNRPTADKFYAQMMVDLFTQALPIREETVPEMLLLDYKRMQRLSLASQRIVTAAAILLQCKNILKRDVRSPWKAEAARIMLVLEAKHDKMETTVHGVMVALEAGRTMPAATKTHLQALVTKVVQASQDSIFNGAEPQEPVLRLLLTRLRVHMFARLGAGSASEKVKAASTAGERLAGLGLAEFATQVREIVDELARVGAVDRAAHTKWWEAVSEKVQQEEAATSTTVA